MKITITFISNIVFEPYLRTYISKVFSHSASDVLLTYIPYSEVNERQNELKNAEIISVCLNFDELYNGIPNEIATKEISYNGIAEDSIQKCNELYSLIRKCSAAKIIWFGFEDYYSSYGTFCGAVPICHGVVDRINQRIIDTFTDSAYIDLKYLIAQAGINSAYDCKGKYRWNAPYSKKLSTLIANEIYKQYLIYTGQTKKCLVIDCDNVLWGGILSDDGIEGIHLGISGLGKVYRDFQRFLLDLYCHGVILAICSKNDLDDVLQVFREHSEMVLNENFVSCFMVNWDNKPSNIKKISDYLNIGLDSIVFVDDSPIEIESVKSLLPEVTTIQFNKHMDYNLFSCFNLKHEYDVKEVEKRTQTYQANKLRNELRGTFSNYDDYVQSLNIVVDIHKSTPVEFNRISELTQRTNKCTNGCRYTIEDIKERANIPNVSLYSVSVSDKFSNLGLVGTIEVENDRLTLFCLSCRALGRDIEYKMIDFLLTNHNIRLLDFFSTTKNDKLKKTLTNIILGNAH